ncbi:MAG: hypothetical protein WBD16_03850 [Pyrinomonadaceae bacterium]
MKKIGVSILWLLSALAVIGQERQGAPNPTYSEISIKKQIVADDLDRQIRDIPLAAVRAFARYRIAAWLWKDGKDDSGRAEQLAIKAVDDLYENKVEIPSVYFNSLGTDLLALLERNARDSAKKLREKHKIVHENGLVPSDSLLNQKGGDKLAVDSVIRSLTNGSDSNSEIPFLVARLKERGSPELVRLLTAVVQAEESGRTRLNSNTLLFVSAYFVEPPVPLSLQQRFLIVVLDKSRGASVTPDGDFEGFFNLLSTLIPSISKTAPALLSEAQIVQTVLRTRASQESKDVQERNDRIREAPDKLAALVGEAERANNNGTKYDLYVSAAQLALKLKRFTYAVDLVEKTTEIDLGKSVLSEGSRKRWRDQFRVDVVDSALQANDADSASDAIRGIADPLLKAESLRKMAVYYFDQANPVFAGYAFDEAIRLVSKTDVTSRSISSFISFLPTAQKIDRNRISEIAVVTAKNINTIPTLNVEDKPGTENYKNYVTSVMIVNWNLLSALSKLVKENRTEASNLTDRINRKEIRVIADFVMMTDSITLLTKQLAANAAEEAPKPTPKP